MPLDAYTNRVTIVNYTYILITNTLRYTSTSRGFSLLHVTSLLRNVTVTYMLPAPPPAPNVPLNNARIILDDNHYRITFVPYR